MTRPNIIFLMSDQHRWDCLGALNANVKTPSLDAMARTGITYTQATCQCPMCVPSRNSMMFGLYPSQLGVRSNGGGFYLEDKLPVPALPEILRQAGYQTAGFGKTHWAHHHPTYNPHPSTRGFEVRYQISEPEEGSIGMNQLAPEALEAYGREVKPFGRGEEDAAGYLGCTSALPMDWHPDGWVAERCLEFLDQGVDPNRPLFLYLSFGGPHAGFNVPAEFEALYDIADIPDIPQPEWSREPDTHLTALLRESNFLRERYEERRNAFEKLTPMERRVATLRYYAKISWLESYYGRVLEKLQAQGRLDDSLIIYVSDHGEMLGERVFNFTKYCLYESSVRVPLILGGSLIPKPRCGTVDERQAELVDVVPTILHAAGLSPNPVLPGLNLLGDRTRRGTFCELHGGGIIDEVPQPAPAYMWRNKKWKLVLYLPGTLVDAVERTDQARGEFYDLESDPHEWNNLYDHAAFREPREQMKTELLMHLACAWAKAPFFCYRDDIWPGRLG